MSYAKQQVPLKVKTPALLLFRTVSAEFMLKINANLPVTHIATGVIKDSPLYKSNGIQGGKHLLSAPSQSIVMKAFQAFCKSKEQFCKSYFCCG